MSREEDREEMVKDGTIDPGTIRYTLKKIRYFDTRYTGRLFNPKYIELFRNLNSMTRQHKLIMTPIECLGEVPYHLCFISMSFDMNSMCRIMAHLCLYA